jgi:hypothetical protein
VQIAEDVVAQVATGPVFGPQATWAEVQFHFLVRLM